VNSDSPAYHIVLRLLRIGLVLSMFWVWWSVYIGLPFQDGDTAFNSMRQAPETLLTISLQPSQVAEGQTLEIPVELYPLDLTAVEREFYSERRAGVRFDDFLLKKLNGRPALKAKFDRDGGASLMVPQGSWWLYTTLLGTVTTEWRVPLNVSGTRQQISLTTENQYMRWKAF
jgi:hypothetical protein